MKRLIPFVICACIYGLMSRTPLAKAADLELFDFNDSNFTTLANAANSINAANKWIEDSGMATSRMAPSSVQVGLDGRPGSYYIVKQPTTLLSNYLQVDNISSGTRYLTAQISGWEFEGANDEQFRLAFINDDDIDFGNTLTAQMQIARDAGGNVILSGSALGVGSTNITNTKTLAAAQNSTFAVTLELNKTSNKYKVFYKDGASETQVLGAGFLAPSRDGNALRMAASGNFGDFGSNFPSAYIDFFAVDKIAVSDTNPFSDLVTLEIDRTNGAMTLKNTSGATISGIQSLAISSAAGGMKPAGWTPIGASVTSSTNSLLAESFGGGGISLTNGQTINLSNAMGAWLKSPYEDTEMVLNLVGGTTRTVNVTYVLNSAMRWATGDLNFDGVISVADYLILKNHAETSLAGLSKVQAYQFGDLSGDGNNDITDFAQFKSIYEAANPGAGGFEAMVASIPEPSSFALAMAAAIALVPIRRRGRNNARSTAAQNKLSSWINRLSGDSTMPRLNCWFRLLVIGLVIAAGARHVQAAVLEDFPFSDANGTTLADVENVAHPGNIWNVTGTGTGELTNSTVQSGVLHIQKTTTALASNYLDIANLTTGKTWLVAEMTGWNLTTTNPSGDVRFGFLDNDPPVAGSSTITAQTAIVKSSGTLLLNGTAIGGGSSNTGTLALPLMRTTPFNVALELDKNLNKYTVYYKDNTADYVPLGTGNLGDRSAGVKRDGNSIRFGVTGSYNDTGEYFDISRIYLTNTSPLGGTQAPTTLGLQINTTNGTVKIVNDTDAAISLDSYRVASTTNALNLSMWQSLAERVPALNPVDGPDLDSTPGSSDGEIWAKAFGSSDGVLAESFLLGNTPINAHGSLDLGQVFRTAGAHNLTFQYHDAVSGSVISIDPTYVAGVSGDYNQNGIVDAADYTIWRDTLGSTTDLRANGDNTSGSAGKIDQADFSFWKAQFGQSGSGGFANQTVPEPTGFVLLLVGILPVVCCRRLKQS